MEKPLDKAITNEQVVCRQGEILKSGRQSCGGSEKSRFDLRRQTKVEAARKWQHIALFASRWRSLLDEDERHPWQTPTVTAWKVVYAVARSVLDHQWCRRYVAVDKCSPDDTSPLDELEIVSAQVRRRSCNYILALPCLIPSSFLKVGDHGHSHRRSPLVPVSGHSCTLRQWPPIGK